MSTKYTSRKTIIILFLHLNIVLAKNIKITSRPVHEIIEEKVEHDKNRFIPFTEYGNPLAGNNKMTAAQQARIHAQHQQAMFIAERTRQQRAQLLKQMAPTQDTYMKAYHDTQEKHHLDLETQHRPMITQRPQMKTKVTPMIDMKYKMSLRPTRLMDPNVIKITKDDAIQKENNRNHRSHGSMFRYARPERSQSVFITPMPILDQGVTIKPHSNIGLNLAHEPTPNPTKTLFTQAIPSKTQVIYPKQFMQMLGYKSLQETALNNLLSKAPQDQLEGLNELVHPLDQPIDLFFYSKHTPSSAPAAMSIPVPVAYPTSYGSGYKTEYQPVKDHTPITEHVEDVADPNKEKVKVYGVQSVLATEEPRDMTTANNYYKVEVANHFVTATEPEHYALQPGNQYVHQNDLVEQYLHHTKVHNNPDESATYQNFNSGIHPLVSEGDDNVSKCSFNCSAKRDKRQSTKDNTPLSRKSTLNSDTFITGAMVSKTTPYSKSIVNNSSFTDIPEFLNDSSAEALRFRHLIPSHNYGGDDYVGEAFDYEYEESLQSSRKVPFQYHDDYDSDESDFSDDYTLNINVQNTFDPHFSPGDSYSQSSSTRPHYHYRKPVPRPYPAYSGYGTPNYGGYSIPDTSYGVPILPTAAYGLPNIGKQVSFGAAGNPYDSIKPQYEIPANGLEPVYILTQSQLKNIVGHHNLNIEHLDVYHMNKAKKHGAKHRVKFHRKRIPHRGRNRYKKLNHNLHKLHGIIH